MTTLYFLQAADRIKIGITKDVRKRIRELQRQNGEAIVLLGSTNGSWLAEKHLHAQLAAHRLHGEWFSDCPEVRAAISRVMENGAPILKHKQAKRTKPFVPGPPRPHHEIIAAMSNLFWPNEAMQKLAEFTEQPVEVCRKWLSGDEEMPRLLRLAFACATLRYMANQEIPMPDTWRRVDAA